MTLQGQLVKASSEGQQSEEHESRIQQQQQLVEAAKQQALQHYDEAKQALAAVQQQLADSTATSPAGEAGASIDSALSIPADLPELQQQAATAAQQLQQGQNVLSSTVATPPQQAEHSSSNQQVAAAGSSQAGDGQLAAAMLTLNETIEDVAQDTNQTSAELSTLVTLLSGQLQRFERRGPAMADTSFMPGLLDAAEVARLSAAAVGDTWQAESSSNQQTAAAAEAAAVMASSVQHKGSSSTQQTTTGTANDTWAAVSSSTQPRPAAAPLGSAELAKLSAAAIGDIPLDAAGIAQLSAGPVGDLWQQFTTSSGQVRTNALLSSAEVAKLSAAAIGDAPVDASDLARWSAAAVGEGWHFGRNAAAEAEQQQQQPAATSVAAILAQLHQAGQQQQGAFSPLQKLLLIDATVVEPQWRKLAAQVSGWTGSQVAAAAQAAQQVSAAVTQLPGHAAHQAQSTAASAVAQLHSAAETAAMQLHGKVALSSSGLRDQVAQLQEAAASAAAGLLDSDVAAAATKLQAKTAAAAAKLQDQAAAAASHAAAVIDEAKSRVDGKGPGEQRTWQEEALAYSGVLSLISPYWWSEDVIAGVAGTAAAGSAGAEPLVQGAYGSDGSGMDGGGAGGAGGAGRGQGPNRGDSSSGGKPDDEGSSGGGNGGDGGSGGSGEGGANGGGGSGGGDSTGGGSSPWDGFDQFPPPGGFDPVLLLPVALAAATSGLTTLFGGSNSSTQKQQKSHTSANPVQHHALQQLKGSSSSSDDSRMAGRQQQELRAREATRAARSVVASFSPQAAVAAGAVLVGAPVVHVPQADKELWMIPSSTPHLHNTALDQPVLTLEKAHACLEADAGAGSRAAAKSKGSLLQAAEGGSASAKHGSLGGPTAAEGSSTAGHRSVLPFSTSQQISWEELEELPLPAKQEILSLRAVVAANKQQQRALQKHLQHVEEQLGAKEQALAASASQIALLEAEFKAAVTELQGFKGAAPHSSAGEAAAAAEKPYSISVDTLRKTFAAQVAHLNKEAAAASSAAALQLVALQAQLDAQQQVAADAVGSLEMRLSKMAASKAKMQLQLEDSIFSRDAATADSQQHAAELQAKLQEALAALQESQEQLQAEQTAQQQLQEAVEVALHAAAAGNEQHSDELLATSGQLAEVAAELAACAAELAASKAHASDLEQQLQASTAQLDAVQADHAAESSKAAAQIADLMAEVAGLKAGYRPVLLGMEAELAVERNNAHHQVAQLKQHLAEAEAAITSQMQQLQQQLNEADASCAAASSRSETLTQQLEAMQQQQGTLVAELESVRGESAHQVAQLEASMRSLQAELQQARAPEAGALTADAEAAGSAGVLACQFTATQAQADQLQSQLGDSLAAATEHITDLEQQICDLRKQQATEAAAAGEQLAALCASSKQQVEDAQAQLKVEKAAAKEQLAALSAELEGVRSGYTTFVAQLEQELAAERSMARRQVAEVQEELQQAQVELDQVQKQLQVLETEKAALVAEHAAQQAASTAQQQSAAQELSSLQDQLLQTKQHEAEALQRCRYLEAELAAATADETAEVTALRDVLEKQRSEMAAQVSCGANLFYSWSGPCVCIWTMGNAELMPVSGPATGRATLG